MDFNKIKKKRHLFTVMTRNITNTYIQIFHRGDLGPSFDHID